MERWQVLALLAGGFCLLVIAVTLRVRFGEKFEIKPIDMAMLVVPLLFVALATGKLPEFNAFGIRMDFSTLLVDAANADIESQVVAAKELPTLPVRGGIAGLVDRSNMDRKQTTANLPRLIEKKLDALTFTLGYGNYGANEIQEYYERLSTTSFLQYLVIQNPDGTLFGVFDVNELDILFRTASEADKSSAYRSFARAVNAGNNNSRALIAGLPGFIPAADAVRESDTKSNVLKRMDEKGYEKLPVINGTQEFVGSVDRAGLTASLILDVVDRLNQTAGRAEK